MRWDLTDQMGTSPIAFLAVPWDDQMEDCDRTLGIPRSGTIMGQRAKGKLGGDRRSLLEFPVFMMGNVMVNWEMSWMISKSTDKLEA